MTYNSNRFTKFWQELKRRKVVKVIIIYASTAFILLQLISILIEPLHLPQWVMTFFVVLLLVGFPIAVIFSWVFDVTPEGIKVTKPVSGEGQDIVPVFSKRKTNITNGIIAVLLIVVVVLVWPRIFKNDKTGNISQELDKSIAVLPFKNDSQDSANVYIINGMMESILNNLSKIKDLRVISRTTVENYRNNLKNIPEIAQELDVSYIVEGSGQKIGDQILLTIQLIEAKKDKHIWSKQYNKEAKDIFNLQIEVSKTIAEEIQAVITPEETERIDKVPTDNLIAYDYFLKAREIYFRGLVRDSDFQNAILLFGKAIEYDNEFAESYAGLALVYYHLGEFSSDEKHTDLINFNADKALAYDPQSDFSLIAKAAFYGRSGDWESGIFYLEKALQYNPNSYLALRWLIPVYRYFNSAKSLEYALQAEKVDVQRNDSIKSIDYFNIAIQFRLLGFFNEAEYYINKSLKANPDNLEAINEKSHLLKDKTGEYLDSERLLPESLAKDSTRIETVRFFYFNYYFMRDYMNAYKCSKKLIELYETRNTTISGFDKLRLANLLLKINRQQESQKIINEIVNDIDKIRDSRVIAAVYSMTGDTAKALEQMKVFSQSENFPYWSIRVFKDDPIYDNIRELHEFKEILSEIETKFWENHKRIKANLTEKGLLPIKM